MVEVWEGRGGGIRPGRILMGSRPGTEIGEESKVARSVGRGLEGIGADGTEEAPIVGIRGVGASGQRDRMTVNGVESANIYGPHVVPVAGAHRDGPVSSGE